MLANIAAALRPGGTFLMVDIKASSNVEDNIDLAWAPFLYMVSTLHCMTVSLALDGDGLGTSWAGRPLQRTTPSVVAGGRGSAARVRMSPANRERSPEQ